MSVTSVLVVGHVHPIEHAIRLIQPRCQNSVRFQKLFDTTLFRIFLGAAIVIIVGVSSCLDVKVMFFPCFSHVFPMISSCPAAFSVHLFAGCTRRIYDDLEDHPTDDLGVALYYDY